MPTQEELADINRQLKQMGIQEQSDPETAKQILETRTRMMTEKLKQTSIYTTNDAENAVRTLLKHLGHDVGAPGLRDTPKRVVKALTEMTEGHLQHPKDVLGTVFEEGFDEVVILRGIPFVSLCEHHLLTFSGTVDVGYLPGEKEGPLPPNPRDRVYKVVGLSKLARLVDVFAKRLQMQERMTTQIADALMEHLDARGAAVVVKSVHSCMTCRGVKKSGADMITSRMVGEFRDNAAARAEFFSLTAR